MPSPSKPWLARVLVAIEQLSGAIGGGSGSAIGVNLEDIIGADANANFVDEPAANTAAVVTLAAPGAGVRNVIGVIGWSYDGEPANGSLTIASGGADFFKIDITTSGPGFYPFLPRPLRLPAGQAVTITLSAAGVGISGIVNTHAWTE